MRPFRRMAWVLIASLAIGHGFQAQAQDPPPASDPQPEDIKKLERVEDPPSPEPAPDPNLQQPGATKLPGPTEVPDVKLAPTLATIPVRRGASAGPNEVVVDSSKLPRDKQGIWVLDFLCKPVRIRTIDVPGKGRKQVYYLWYRVINRTGEARMFVPQFTLITDSGKRYDDEVIPAAIPVIQARENGIRLRGAVDIMGMIPPSQKENVDDAVYGVAVWTDVDPAADSFKINVRGLSDGYQISTPPAAPDAPAAKTAKPVVKYKTLRLDFASPGDEINRTENEIRFEEPPYEWIYW